MIYLNLFISFFKIGLFSIGGGYAAMPLIKSQVVDLHQWLTLKEFTDIITIAEMTPGSVSLNCATFVGIQIAGIKGALVATLGCITPSFIVVMIFTFLYFKYGDLKIIKGILRGLRPAVVGLIASAGTTIALIAFFGDKINIQENHINYISVAIFLCAVIALRKFKINPICVMLVSEVFGIGIYEFLV